MSNTNKTILIIEDNADIRENLAEILALAGYTSLTAPNGKVGAATALQHRPDLILCDIMMPELDGYGVLHILSKQQATADIPFVFLTAKSEKDDFRRGMSLGADDYITKPFDDVQLLETIAARLRKSERLRQAAQPVTSSLEQLVSEAKAMQILSDLPNLPEVREFRKKELVFRENDTPRWLYQVQSGSVKIFKTSDDGRELITQVLGAGAFFGYTALLQGVPHGESAAALDTTEIRLISKADFQSLVSGNRDVNAYFVKMLAGHVAEREQQLIDLAYNSVRRRVATMLLHFFDQGQSEIHLLREDLAAMVGTAKETLIRTLTDFKQEKLLDIREGVVVVLQPQKLRQLPN